MSKVKNIVPAPLFQRTFAAVIDLVLVILIGAGVFLGFSNLASNFSAVKAYINDYNNEIVTSGLMQLEKNELKPYEYVDYEHYQEMFYNFYNVYYSKQTKSEINYDVYWFNVFIYGQKDELNKYTDKELNSRPALMKVVGPSLFTYAKEGEETKYDQFALPRASENGTKALSDYDKTELRQYFYISDKEAKDNEKASTYRYVYFYALADITSLSKLQNDYNKYALYGVTLPLVIAIIFTFMIFYFVIPLFFKNGETIGKKVMHICLVNKLGYQYKRIQLLPRVLFPTLLTIIIVFFAGFSIWAFAGVSAVILISFLFVIFTKDNKAIHDFFAGTLVIDAKQSTWFKDINEEENAEKDVADYVEQVRANNDALTDKNIIYTNPHFKDKK